MYVGKNFDPRFREKRRLERMANELLRKGGKNVSRSKSKKNRKQQAHVHGTQRSVPSGEGDLCPKCGKPMARRQHPETWKPKANQPYYFEYWDVCGPCRHIQHYESAKRWLKEPPKSDVDPLTREWREIIG